MDLLHSVSTAFIHGRSLSEYLNSLFQALDVRPIAFDSHVGPAIAVGWPDFGLVHQSETNELECVRSAGSRCDS